MPGDNRTLCPLWPCRGSGAKRFPRGDDAVLRYRNFSEDVPRRQPGEKSPATLTHPAGKTEPI